MQIRAEEPRDIPAIHSLNKIAFAGPTEADLVDQLRHSGTGFLSLVAEDEDIIVGHILFTSAVIEHDGKQVFGMGLAPLAVAPDRQRQGIGTALVEHGLGLLRKRGCPFVIVLGHPDYYPRFGFERASLHHLACQWEGVPDDAFMVLILDPAAMRGVSGFARYRDEFDAAM
jgi:putative acetyltransferase